MISGNFRWLVATSTTEIISPGFLSSAPIVMWNAAFFSLSFFRHTRHQNERSKGKDSTS